MFLSVINFEKCVLSNIFNDDELTFGSAFSEAQALFIILENFSWYPAFNQCLPAER